MGGRITLVTGGARSGKSNYAESLAKDSKKEVAYLATAIPFDEGMKDRIKKHKLARPGTWITYEGYKDLYKMIPKIKKEHEVVLLDCITIMVTNLMFEEDVNWDKIEHEGIDQIEEKIKEQIVKLLTAIREYNIWCIMVTNELGMGIVPENRISRIFRDIAGRMNQMIAKEADEVYFTVSGIPMQLK
ncbi:bifunctional adenosylcobinamide kinase/adenosylcobinamide-phosphate guanylyltransferase [Crassaminicella profunda]|uniref:bifunctional adenosylcobinamide kinase/adenosylcobinamide-phosphate guanylyltransferase n=1 Tax=Crassaminicella profunda TaxID=1286698 RepID=UPI001CA74D2F|nr:bifunctional adenosylcobinamide kinase/adenosylcobinamide-phosphate guanylyltransferase [Crassaminicella profunda]QZY57375.1 bifunctional adenosylcobinamide kinase/adenosylcobinamide-phosphate guanylyltransferase [Crassaminicella profunda]